MATKRKHPALSTRDRILHAAKRLFQQRGYYAVGTAEILDVARAPKGSMYHHFPEGKEQIAIEAVNTMRVDVMSMMQELASAKLSVADSIRKLAKGMASWLKTSEWREGTMLASTTVGSVPNLPQLHAAIKAAFDEWREHLTTLLMEEKWSKASAQTMAYTIIAAIEGAMILARIDQDERIVIKVSETLACVVESGQP
ncbi:MAG: TetR/AcrR family transcriptional regulator [Candidatus Obscuribacterales bacterium]|nr:TetR/AcrR family transcriptional regulator [Steroidobacteraceae bacterium]